MYGYTFCPILLPEFGIGTYKGMPPGFNIGTYNVMFFLSYCAARIHHGDLHWYTLFSFLYCAFRPTQRDINYYTIFMACRWIYAFFLILLCLYNVPVLVFLSVIMIMTKNRRYRTRGKPTSALCLYPRLWYSIHFYPCDLLLNLIV